MNTTHGLRKDFSLYYYSFPLFVSSLVLKGDIQRNLEFTIGGQLVMLCSFVRDSHKIPDGCDNIISFIVSLNFGLSLFGVK